MRKLAVSGWAVDGAQSAPSRYSGTPLVCAAADSPEARSGTRPRGQDESVRLDAQESRRGVGGMFNPYSFTSHW
jgi:hypothetical protein